MKKGFSWLLVGGLIILLVTFRMTVAFPLNHTIFPLLIGFLLAIMVICAVLLRTFKNP